MAPLQLRLAGDEGTRLVDMSRAVISLAMTMSSQVTQGAVRTIGRLQLTMMVRYHCSPLHSTVPCYPGAIHPRQAAGLGTTPTLTPETAVALLLRTTPGCSGVHYGAKMATGLLRRLASSSGVVDTARAGHPCRTIPRSRGQTMGAG